MKEEDTSLREESWLQAQEGTPSSQRPDGAEGDKEKVSPGESLPPQQSVIYPISCVECRRRKIKCCKRYPCVQCSRKNIRCEYPEKFRSIEVNNLLSNDNSTIVSPLDTSGSNILSSTISVNIAKENEVLKRKVVELERKLGHDPNGSNVGNETANTEDYDNDTELSKEKYYGPNSSVFMIRSTQDAKFVEFNDFMKEKKILSKKRELPFLLSSFERNDKNTKITNFSLICKIVTVFFQLRNYFNNFISEKEVFNFLHNYTNIKNWSNDDDLLLLIMILVTTIRSLRRDDSLLMDNKINYDVLNKKLMAQFDQLKNGMKNETIKSLKLYVLACEHYYYHSQAETSWNLLFHTVSNAYSLGLHVYDKEIEISLKNSKKNTFKVIQNDPRTSLWLTINFISTVLCSVVGRPNPVSFTFQPLTNSEDINLNYKIALSEISKKSTQMLIDSYRISISFADINNIDEDFEREIEVYEKLFQNTCDEQRELELQELEKWKRRTKRQRTEQAKSVPDKPQNDLQTILNHQEEMSTNSSSESEQFSLLDTPCETLCDLILFYSNRAKLHQPFMSTYQTSTKILLHSVSKTIQHTINLVKILSTKIGNPNFQSIYPFFYCFLYQSFIVFYTFLHLNFENILFFYKQEILEIHRNLQTLFDKLQGYWKKNALRIINQIFQLVNKFKDQYNSFTKNATNVAIYPSLSNTNLSAFSDQSVLPYDNLHQDLDHGIEIPSSQQRGVTTNPASPSRMMAANSNVFQWDKGMMDKYHIDPILGFDLNDPFFMSNPEGGIPNDYFGQVGNNSDNKSTTNSVDYQNS